MAQRNQMAQRTSRSVRAAAFGAIAALGLSAGAQRAMAQFALSSEDRQISSSTDGDVGDTDDVTNAGPYSNTVTDGDASPLPDGDNRQTSTTASQTSDIETSGFSGMGSGQSSAMINGLFADGGTSSGDSSFMVTFSVPVATVIQLTGELDLTDNGTATVSFDAFNDSAGGAYSFSETVQPGTSYTLSLDGNSMSNASIDGEEFESISDDGTGSFTFNFEAVSVPEPVTSALLLVAAPGLMARRRREAAAAKRRPMSGNV